MLSVFSKGCGEVNQNIILKSVESISVIEYRKRKWISLVQPEWVNSMIQLYFGRTWRRKPEYGRMAFSFCLVTSHTVGIWKVSECVEARRAATLFSYILNH